jgi:hypothetical protein
MSILRYSNEQAKIGKSKLWSFIVYNRVLR